MQARTRDNPPDAPSRRRRRDQSTFGLRGHADFLATGGDHSRSKRLNDVKAYGRNDESNPLNLSTANWPVLIELSGKPEVIRAAIRQGIASNGENCDITHQLGVKAVFLHSLV